MGVLFSRFPVTQADLDRTIQELVKTEKRDLEFLSQGTIEKLNVWAAQACYVSLLQRGIDLIDLTQAAPAIRAIINTNIQRPRDDLVAMRTEAVKALHAESTRDTSTNAFVRQLAQKMCEDHQISSTSKLTTDDAWRAAADSYCKAKRELAAMLKPSKTELHSMDMFNRQSELTTSVRDLYAAVVARTIALKR